MAIQNQLGNVSPARSLARAHEGSWADKEGGRARPMSVPLLAQISNVAISGFGADADSITVHIDLPNGTRQSNTTTRAAGVPVDDAAAAVALADLINADEELNGHVVATTSTSNLILTFQHPNIVYPVSTAVTAAVATVTTTQAAGGTSIAVARFVKAAATPAAVDGVSPMANLEATDDEFAILGVTLRTLDLVNAESPLATAVDQIPAGRLGGVAYKGNVNMRNNGSVASVPGGKVYAVRSASGGDEVGEARADVSGVASLWTATPVAVNDQEYGMRIIWRGVTYEEIVQGDASATATEISDAFRAAFGTIAGLTFGGTATVTIAGAAGEPLTVQDLGPGDSGVVETTPAVVYAVELDRKRVAWHEVVQPGEIGPVHLDLP